MDAKEAPRHMLWQQQSGHFSNSQGRTALRLIMTLHIFGTTAAWKNGAQGQPKSRRRECDKMTEEPAVSQKPPSTYTVYAVMLNHKQFCDGVLVGSADSRMRLQIKAERGGYDRIGGFP